MAEAEFKPWGFAFEVTQIAAPQWLKDVALRLGPRFVEIQKAVVDRQIVYKTSHDVCRVRTVAELKAWIEQLRPITLDKANDPLWQAEVMSLAAHIDHMRTQTGADVDLVRRRQRESVKIPNFMVDGLPGFSYPSRITPPLIKIEAPSGKPLPPGPEGHRKDTTMGFSYNHPSIIFGAIASIGDRFIDSPLKPKRGWKCADFNKLKLPNFDFKLPDLKMVFDIKMPKIPAIGLPDISLGGGVLSLPPCIAQFTPPMFMPRIKIPAISLGGGAEMGIVKDGVVAANNFGTAFKANANKIAPLVSIPVGKLAGMAAAATGAVSKVTGGINSLASQMSQKANLATALAAGAAIKGLVANGSSLSSLAKNNPFTQALQQATSAATSLKRAAVDVTQLPLSSVGLKFGASSSGGLALGFKSNTLKSMVTMGGSPISKPLQQLKLPNISGLTFKTSNGSLNLPNLQIPTIKIPQVSLPSGLSTPKIPDVVPKNPSVPKAVPDAALNALPKVPASGDVKKPPVTPEQPATPEKKPAISQDVVNAANQAIASGVATVKSMKAPSIPLADLVHPDW